MEHSIESFTFAPGFHAAATACGLKPSGNLDLALLAADQPCRAAGVFTTNRVKAAPVLYDQAVLAESAGAVYAVLTNAGCANACTGPQGMENARRMAALAAEGLGCRPEQVLVLSTGVIGRQLDMEKLASGIADVVAQGAPEGGAALAARAIMTTDTRPKVASQRLSIGGREVTISGCCKGSGMIHPNMATMLAIITTDADIEAGTLQRALTTAVARSFNRISVDGDTSTNDTVLLLASGASGVRIGAENNYDAFVKLLTQVCEDLAKQVARDGEGATRLVAIRVTGALDETQAHTVANSIARSPLVKTAIHGGDPNWGRILCAAGYSGAELDADRLALAFVGDETRVELVGDGLPLSYSERAAAALLHEDPVQIELDLGLGSAETTVWTCDLSKEYIEINAHYTT